MKVIIMKCSADKVWYKDKIGKTYKVHRSDDKLYMVRDKNSIKSIARVDCEIIEK
ncbi:hypothetical protein ACLD43_18590 [Clostridium botulinum]|uniref:hypothetical protein n=1 Tax=Clostridium botulinum TaxID=1491 RepID=UPI003A813891